MPEVRPVGEGTIHISSLVLALARVPGVHGGVGWWAEHAGPQSSAVLGCTSLCRAGITNSVRITLLCARPCWSPPHKEGALPQSPMLSGVREHRTGLKKKTTNEDARPHRPNSWCHPLFQGESLPSSPSQASSRVRKGNRGNSSHLSNLTVSLLSTLRARAHVNHATQVRSSLACDRQGQRRPSCGTQEGIPSDVTFWASSPAEPALSLQQRVSASVPRTHGAIL